MTPEPIGHLAPSHDTSDGRRVPIATACRPDPSGIQRRGYAGKGFNTGCANAIDDWYRVLGVSDGPRVKR
jgi:hypothetical protein